MDREADDGASWLPATHSIPDTAALAGLLAERYGLADARVRFLRPGLNDVFEVSVEDPAREAVYARPGAGVPQDPGAGVPQDTVGGRRYVLRVYRTGWRTDEDIGWECDLLRHLAAAGVPVHQPIAASDGEPFVVAMAPEGRRQLLLLSYADGRLTRGGPTKGSKPSVTEVAEQYGALAGAIHAGGDDLDTGRRRFPLDVEHLLRRPLLAALPLLAHRQRDAAWLADRVDLLADRIAAVAPRLDHGPCHGDLTGENAVLRDGKLTMFDFDSGGPGWRSYDVACFGWSMTLHGAGPDAVERFRRGYESVRELKDDDWSQLPLFQAVRQVWFIGMQTENAGDWGHSKADDDFFDWQFQLLERLLTDVV